MGYHLSTYGACYD